MILEIDHLAISPERIKRYCKILEKLGYTVDVITPTIRNLRIKKKLMKNYSNSQDLTLLRSNGNIGIEFVNHKSVNPSIPYIFPIFENVPSPLTEPISEKKFGSVILKSRLRSFYPSIFVFNDDKIKPKFRFNKIIIKTPNIRNSISFWKLFGFKVLHKNIKYTDMEFKSLLRKNDFHLYLEQDHTINPSHYLDDNCFNCIAFISNSVKNEKELLGNNGIKTTQIEGLEINGKFFNIFFATSQQGEIVELISPDRKKDKQRI